MDMLQQIDETCAFLHKEGIKEPHIGVILGTGLGRHFLEELRLQKSLDYKSIPGFLAPTVEFHSGRLHYASYKDDRQKLVVLEGRFHFYEGYSMQQITFPVRILKALGAAYLLISNAAGNLNPCWNKGELMLIEDHINLQTDHPLRGPNKNALGPRFPDMSAPYSHTLNEKLHAIAAKNDILLRQGVYVALTGPSLETRAEYRFLRTIGADAVGMSTVPEVIVAAHSALPCCALSVLTDDCDPKRLKAVSIPEIMAIAAKAEIKLSTLYLRLIEELSEN